ncbi:MAG: DUF4105 domain-containing protein [Fuerstiella sp.]
MNRLKFICLKSGRVVLWTLPWTCTLLFFGWSAGAIYCLEFLPRLVSVPLALIYSVAGFGMLVRMQNRKIWLRVAWAAVLVIYAFHLLQRPSNDRPWAEDNARLVEVDIRDGHVHIDALRHSVYRTETDYDVHYRNYDFSLEQLDKVWFVVQRFTALEGIAHNFLTFRVQTDTGPEYFSVSAEIRREHGETFSPLKGLYRQYELIYILADERDEIGARTVVRPDDRVFMYPVNASPAQVQQLFREIAVRLTQLRTRPEFYHSLLNNCTNNIVLHTYPLTPEPINWLDPRIVAPGFADRFAFATGLIGEPGQRFTELRQKCRIDAIARQVGFADDFSARIRSAQSSF